MSEQEKMLQDLKDYGVAFSDNGKRVPVMDVWLSSNVCNIGNIDRNIDALQRVIDNKPKLACDDTLLIDIKHILIGMKNNHERTTR